MSLCGGHTFSWRLGSSDLVFVCRLSSVFPVTVRHAPQPTILATCARKHSDSLGGSTIALCRFISNLYRSNTEKSLTSKITVYLTLFEDILCVFFRRHFNNAQRNLICNFTKVQTGARVVSFRRAHVAVEEFFVNQIPIRMQFTFKARNNKQISFFLFMPRSKATVTCRALRAKRGNLQLQNLTQCFADDFQNE